MPEPASLTELGLVGLFVAAFLAGSILPFASEAVLVGVLLLGTSPITAVSVATAGNVLGALSLYGMGRLAGAGLTRDDDLAGRLLARLSREDPARLERARQRLERWGPVVLLASWVPVLGDALVLAAGLLPLPVAPVTLFATLGKGTRYVLVAIAVTTVG